MLDVKNPSTENRGRNTKKKDNKKSINIISYKTGKKKQTAIFGLDQYGCDLYATARAISKSLHVKASVGSNIFKKINEKEGIIV